MSTRHRLAAGVVAALTTVGLVAAVPAPAHAAGKPDLRVLKVTVDGGTVTEGAELAVSHVVANRGRRAAGASTTRFYLTTDVTASFAERRASRTHPRSALTDVLLHGSAAVPSIRAGGRKTVSGSMLTVPVGTPPGAYTLLAYTDDTGAVREADEADNCTAASRVTVEEAAGSDSLYVQQFSDTYAWPDDERESLEVVKIFCQGTRPAQKLTLAAALAAVETFLEQHAGAGALDEVADSGQADTPEAAQELAATAVAAGSPGLALAALLRAHRLDPGSGSHLVNAAALATSLGLPNEAIALLDAAVGRRFLRAPLAVSQQATALVIRGHALVQTGRLDEARTMFAQAKRLAPLLSEADTGLATVEACQGRDALAMRYLRLSRQRSDEPVPPTPPTEDPERPDPEIDLSTGTPMELRELPIAATPAQGVAMRDVYRDVERGFEQEIAATQQERDRLRSHLDATDGARTRAERQRRDSLLSLVHQAHLEPEVQEASRAFEDKLAEVSELIQEFWGTGTGPEGSTYLRLIREAGETCEGSEDPHCLDKEINRTCRPALTTAHAEWVSLMRAAQQLGQEYLALWSRRMSGVAANLLDEEAHRLALLSIEEAERAIYAGIVAQAHAWTQFEWSGQDHCVEPLPAEVLEPPAREAAASPGRCQESLGKLSLKAALGPSSLKVSCERIEQSFSADVLPLVSVFADVVFDFRTGRMTVFLGVKGGGKVANVVDAGFKSGAYLTVDNEGRLHDAGWRVGPTVKFAGGNAELTAVKDEIDISFVPDLAGAQ